jgi:isoleucyl-tRNA synthetase
MTAFSFRTVPAEPNHPELEHRILERWERERTFERLRELRAGGPTFSFFDGPITANNPMGAHHAWGRSLKDLFQRYQAALGKELRYQNGFDCQGLWVEVEVEKSLGLNSKRDIETYGLERFVRACRDRVAEYSGVQTRQSERLGQWMDWERSYFTMTDPNISYIWGFLQECNRRGWLYRGHRPMTWCARCGTSLSQHEVTATDSYRDVVHTALTVRFRLLDATDEHLLIWTTTPWTLPANVAAAVNPSATYARVATDAARYVVAADRVEHLFGAHARVEATFPGSELVGRPYQTGFDDLPVQADVEHRVLGWDDVALDEGTGVVHIAPGCGAEDFELGVRDGLPVLTPVDDAGAFYDTYGWLHGVHTHEATDRIVDHLGRNGWLFLEESYPHRYPVCWRCGTELIFRVVDEWFISADEVREPMIEANRTVEWTPTHYGKRMEDWLRNMGDWCISRKRYWGLPLPFYQCPEGHLTVVGSKEELLERATQGVEGLEELHRPWIDPVRIRCGECACEAERVPEVGDCWLDAGIIPFSTIGYGRDEVLEEGFAAGAGVGLTKADLPDNAYWERWFPADWVSEMREQIRLWFYSQLFMSVALTGKAPYRAVLGYEKLHDETGRPMHKSWGNAIWFDDAVERMGADVMRWTFAGQNPAQNMSFGYGPADAVRRRLHPLWNSYRFLALNAAPEGYRPDADERERGPRSEHLLDRWLLARVQELVRDAREALDRWSTPDYVRACERFFDDLSNWYVRGSRPRFWAGDRVAFAVLHHALERVARVIAPAMPFLAEELWEGLVVDPLGDAAPDSVHLAGFPEVDDELLDEALLAAMANARAVVELGHQARAEAGQRLRQPFASAAIASADPSLLPGLESLSDLVAAELNVKRLEFVSDAGSLVERQVIPNFRVLGPRLGARVQELKAALAEGSFAPDDEGRVHVADLVLEPGDYELRVRSREGFEAVDDGRFVVAVDTRITDELAREGLARDVVRHLQNVRKELGFEVADRIVVQHATDDAELALTLDEHGESIAREVLAEGFAQGAASGHPFPSAERPRGFFDVRRA